MNETVKIMNRKQVTFYIKNGIKPVDIIVGYNDYLVYIFDKEQTKGVWEKWKRITIESKIMAEMLEEVSK